MSVARVSTSLLLLAALIRTGTTQTCTGNGFVGGCSDIFTLTGEPVGMAELVGSGQVASVCEGDRLAVVHDCLNRVPLYVTILLDRASIDASNPGRCDACDFRPSTHIDGSFQATDDDYNGANDRLPCYERQTDSTLYRDLFWLDDSSPEESCFPSEPTTGTSRGHMIADSFVRVPESDKDATYHFTNCIPQFQKFNNEAWNIAEQDMYPWLQNHCGSGISDPVVRDNAKLHLMVGAVPSTSIDSTFTETDVTPRWFGEWGFGDGVFTASIDYNGNIPAFPADYRVNMPAAMWTAACCVATDANNNVVHVRHTAYGRDAKPVGNDNPVVETYADDLIQQMLPGMDTSGVNLWPNEPMCNDPAFYVAVSVSETGTGCRHKYTYLVVFLVVLCVELNN